LLLENRVSIRVELTYKKTRQIPIIDSNISSYGHTNIVCLNAKVEMRMYLTMFKQIS